MGQDRDFTRDQKKFILETVCNFRDIWEEEQRDNLTRDRDDRLELFKEVTAPTPEPVENEDEEEVKKLSPFEQIEKDIEDYFVANEEVDDDKKEFKSKEIRLQKTGRMFIDNEQWKGELQTLTRAKVLKLPRILQSIMYLNGFEKKDITVSNSQLFDWNIGK